MVAIDFGPSSKNKMATIDHFKLYVISKLWTPLVYAIFLDWFHQLTPNLIYAVIPPQG